MEVLNLIPAEWREKIQLLNLSGAEADVKGTPTCVGVSESLDASAVLSYAIFGGLRHICQADGIFFNQEVLASAQMAISPEDFLNYPASVVLKPGQVDAKTEESLTVFSRSFVGSMEKDQVLEEFKAWAESVARSSSFVSEMTSVADELFMNAVYNAPFLDSQGVRENVSLTSQEVKEGRGKAATLFAGIENKQLVIGCRDDWGTLRLDKLFQRIKGTFEKGVAENMNMGDNGGAGIGSYMIYTTGISYYAGVDPGKRTVVCCKVPLGMSNRKRSEQPKNLHYFEIEKK